MPTGMEIFLDFPLPKIQFGWTCGTKQEAEEAKYLFLWENYEMCFNGHFCVRLLQKTNLSLGVSERQLVQKRWAENSEIWFTSALEACTKQIILRQRVRCQVSELVWIAAEGNQWNEMRFVLRVREEHICFLQCLHPQPAGERIAECRNLWIVKGDTRGADLFQVVIKTQRLLWKKELTKCWHLVSFFCATAVVCCFLTMY